MKILLLGANGRTGREFLARALCAGNTLTALVRAEDRLADLRHERLEVHVGSPCAARVLEPLLPGHDAVVSVLGPRWPSRSASAIYSQSAEAIVAAMQASPVHRLVVTSSALLFPTDSLFDRTLRRLVPRIVEAAGQMEERIRNSRLDWTIARTGFLTNDSAMTYRLGIDSLPDGAGSVSRAALASFLLSETQRASHSRQVVGLSG